MPRGPSPGWRQRKEPVTDDYIAMVITRAKGKHDPSGHYGTGTIRDLADREEAAEYKRSLFRCALWMHRNGVASVSISMAKIERDPGRGYKLTFRVTSKAHAMQHQLTEHGADPAAWAYDPRKRASA